MVKKTSVGMKIVSVILGALMSGFMWRCRGSGGWGSSWGLYGVGLVLMLLIYHFYSDRSGMKFEAITIGSFLLGLGVTGYATVIIELSGILWSDLPYSGQLINGQQPEIFGPNGDVIVPVSPISGGIIIFIMGFTLVPLFTIFVASLFSDKKYSLKDYVIISVIFFVASLAFKATIAHPILKLINPEQVQYAALGLKNNGLDYSSPMSAYMSHFLDRRWTQEIPFFENYYMSIEHVADALAVLTISGYVLFARKDKYTAFGSIIVDALTAAATTALSPLLSSNEHAGLFENVELPNWFEKLAEWGSWEYFTGFFFGFFLMLFIAVTEGRHSVRTGYDDTPLFADKKANFAFNLISTLFIFCITPSRIIAIRFARLLENYNILPDDEPLATILIVIISIVLGILVIKALCKNILEKGSNAIDMLPVDFARKALPIYLLLCFFAYFFLDDVYILNINESITIPIMLITSALIAIIYIPAMCKLNKKEKAG